MFIKQDRYIDYTLESCTKHKFQSLIGSLNHTASVIGPDCTFLQEIIGSLSIASTSTCLAQMDPQLWNIFLEWANGISLMAEPYQAHSVFMLSDASGSWGCGTWIQMQWEPDWQEENIATKDLVSTVAVAALSVCIGSPLAGICGMLPL